jgi:hypothetical protein
MDLPRGDERARVEQWLHSVEHDRGLPLTFLASAKPSAELSETRWMTVRMSHVASNENPLHASSADESNGGGTGGGGDATADFERQHSGEGQPASSLAAHLIGELGQPVS